MSTRGSRSLKLLDRYVGVPLVALLGVRPRRALPKTVTRIGLMKTAALGDMVLTAGLVDDIKATFHQARLFMIAGLDNAGAVPLLGPAVDSTITVSPRHPLDAARAIRALDLDILVDLGSWPRFDALLAALSGARFTAGFRTTGQQRHFAYDATVDHSREAHERTNYERLLETIGVVARTPARIHAPNVLAAGRVPRAPFAVFHPWASGHLYEAREWPPERWTSLAASLSPRVEHIVVTGSKGEVARTQPLVRALAAAGLTVTDMSGQLSLTELADVLAASSVVVSVNTGVAHLAGLVGARTVTLHGPTPRTRWAPLGPRTRTVASTLPGCEYLNLGFEYEGQRLDCMDGVSVEAVLVAIADLLDTDDAG